MISIIIFISSGMPIVYRQKRTGKRGKTFTMYKFRTMAQNADGIKAYLKEKNEAKGPVFKIHNDPRFTKIGKFLSHVGLDELPQLFNILKGDMVLIGPRPLPVLEAKKLTNWQKKRHLIRPGIISPWIVNGYHSQSFSKWMQSDIEYIRRKTLSYDISIFLKSVFFVISMCSKELSAVYEKQKSKYLAKNIIRNRKMTRPYKWGNLD